MLKEVSAEAGAASNVHGLLLYNNFIRGIYKKKKAISIYNFKIYIYISTCSDVTNLGSSASTAKDWNVMQEDLDYFEKQKAEFIWKSKGR